MNYAVKEAFYTLQGEGAFTGTPAVFVRFAGCNLWSGRAEDRERDSVKGGCARWCDTDFRGTDGARGGRYSAIELAALVRELHPGEGEIVAVLTGGEPGLQVDAALIVALHASGIRAHIETNGTCALPDGLDWITVSPKPPAVPIPQRYDEVKLVFRDDHDPIRFRALAPIGYLQPLWSADVSERARSLKATIAYTLEHPEWRLSLQTHKLIDLP